MVSPWQLLIIIIRKVTDNKLKNKEKNFFWILKKWEIGNPRLKNWHPFEFKRIGIQDKQNIQNWGLKKQQIKFNELGLKKQKIKFNIQ